MANFFGNLLDKVGTSLNLPEYGLSELFSGGASTQNTGRIAPTNNPSGNPILSQASRNLQSFPIQNQPQTQSMGVVAAEPTLEDYLMQLTQGAAAGGGGAAATSQADIKLLPDGRKFDLNDAGQRLAYSQALQQILGTQRDQALQQAQNAFATGDKQAVSQYQQYISQLDQNLSDVQAQAQQYATDYQGTLDQFNQGKQSGDIGRQNYFASISPNAFQSSQATSQGAADTQYAKGLADLTNQAQSTVGLDYLNNPSAGVNAFAPESQFGRNVSSLNTQRQGLQNNFNDYRTNAQNQFQQNQSAIGQNYQNSLNSQNASLGQVDLAQGTNPFQYGLQSVQPYQAPKADLSQYSQYTDFNSLANPTAQGSSYVKPVSSTNAFSQPQIDNYLGRTNTKLTTPQQDTFMKYLQGKVTA